MTNACDVQNEQCTERYFTNCAQCLKPMCRECSTEIEDVEYCPECADWQRRKLATLGEEASAA